MPTVTYEKLSKRAEHGQVVPDRERAHHDEDAADTEDRTYPTQTPSRGRGRDSREGPCGHVTSTRFSRRSMEPSPPSPIALLRSASSSWK